MFRFTLIAFILLFNTPRLLAADFDPKSPISDDEAQFIIDHVTPDEQNRIVRSLAVAGGDANSRQTIMLPYRLRLAAKGVRFGLVQVDHRPHPDLAAYAPFEIPKGADWLPIGDPEPGHERQTGFYVESLKPQSGGETVRRNVGSLTTWENAQRRASIKTVNANGMTVGPQWTFYPQRLAPTEQVKEIRVYGGATATAELLDAKAEPSCTEILGFGPDGAITRWLRTENGRLVDTAYGAAGQITAERIVAADHSFEERTFYPDGKPKRVLTGRDATDTSGYTETSETTWAANGDLSLITVHGKRIDLPARSDATPATAMQLVTWLDDADHAKGPAEVAFVVSESDHTKVGPAMTWCAIGKPTASGSYAAGSKDGEWMECETVLVKGAPEISATARGRYLKGVRVGAWKTELSQFHPDRIAIEERNKKAAAASHAAGATINDEEGYVITELYRDGKVVETQKNF